ncbi:MAG TPA: TIGR03557 family F420-dependent LLM class oxidoreductase, partial [Ilumatobacter sp.]|nr:TIGR03557 family F420-dependent LLM class oxidoreductase [Ilumatobacter sp.]
NNEQGQSPFVWSVIGAISQVCDLPVTTAVTCPTVRTHPAVIAQAAATSAVMLDGRFVLGLGSGEALNEHILGDRWPTAPERLAMLEEAVGVIRQLWTGEQVNHSGAFYEVENARLYDAPDPPPPVVVSAFGPMAAQLAARVGDGLWTTGVSAETIETWRDAGGEGPVYSQINVCWLDDRDEALEVTHTKWRNGGVPGQLSQDLPTPAHFEMASSIVRPEDLAESVIVGRDHDRLAAEVGRARDAGVDHLYFHQIGDDQQAFVDEWQAGLRELVTGA